MKVLILAAGYGTRLYPQTKNYPKPLLKLNKKPIINYLLEKIGGLKDVSRIIVVTNSRFFKQFQAWRDNLRPRRPIRLLNDKSTNPGNKLGAIGDMCFSFCKEGFDSDFLILGGDNILKGSLSDFVRFARSKRPSVSIGLFDIKDRREARRFGVVSINKKNRVVEFSEKPAKPQSSLVAMCLYYFPKEKVNLIKEYLSDSQNCRDAAGSYISWLSRKDKVYGYVFTDFWFDIGHKIIYKKAERAFKNKE
ncbi:MAG: nucleotidyltransferase family protein [Candidatus Omnitrophota bacterium]